MTLSLLPGYAANIELRDTNNRVLYQTRCTTESQAKEFIAKYAKSREGFSLLQSAIVPLRTDNLKAFFEDLFLPTFVHFSSKINNFAIRVLASVFAIAFDIATLPVRLLTTPWQVYNRHNNPEGKHPAMELIQGNPHEAENLVDLCYEVQNVQMSNPTHENGNTFQKAEKSLIKGTIQVALKKLPGYSSQVKEEEEKTSYLRMNTDWVIENYHKNSSSQYCISC